MHSREKSSCCKQSTYEILIENEFQYVALTLPFPTAAYESSLAVASEANGPFTARRRHSGPNLREPSLSFPATNSRSKKQQNQGIISSVLASLRANPKGWRMRFFLLSMTLVILCGTSAWPQAEQQEAKHHGMMHAMDMQHRVSKTAKLTVKDDAAAQAMTLRVGPVALPSHSDHSAVAQPPDLFLTIPFDGWLTAYHPRLTDEQGHPLPNKLLHHAAFWNTGRPDFLCTNKEEHIFGAGGEMNDWPAIPGYGYRIHKGDRIRISAMFANPSAKSYSAVFLEVRMEYRVAGGDAPKLQDVYPAWFDVMHCGNSGYDLAPGLSMKTGQFRMRYAGKLLGVGGHLHDYGQWLVLRNVTTKEPIATLGANVDAHGQVVSMPIESFASRGGFPLKAGDVIEVTDAYNNTSGKKIPEGAMGIVVGYFLPDDPLALEALRRPPPAQ